MSEQEKSEVDVVNKSSVVVVEQEPSADSRHKPYRPTELQDEQPELHHKRSKAPAVPSVAEKLKNKPDDTVHEDKSERKVDERASSEKHKHVGSKKSRSKKQGSTTSPETIALAALEVREKGAVSSQPIPVDVKSITSAVSEPIKPVGKITDEDSITEDIAELQTPKTERKISEWQSVDIDIAEDVVTDIQDQESLNKQPNDPGIEVSEQKIAEGVTEVKIDEFKNQLTNTQKLQKKEISWNDPEYLNRVHLQMQVERQELKLERKASVGPCFRPGMPYEGPSGFKLCMPGKSNKNLTEDFKPVQSGISIRVSKRCLNSKTKSKIDVMEDNGCKETEKGQIDKIQVPKTLREKLDNMWCRIRHSLNNL